VLVLGTVEACGKGAQTGSGQASPRQAKRRLPRLAPLYVTADAVRLCISSSFPPNFQVLMSKTLTATYFYENFVPLLLRKRLADVLPPGSSIPSFPAVEQVIEPVPRVRMIRLYSTTVPCDLLSIFPLLLNQAEVPVCGVLHHTVCFSYDGGQ
jgi:hypothetical protein